MHQQKLRAFHHDHNYGVKEIKEEVIICEQPGGVSSLTVNEVGIPVEVGKCTLGLYGLCINCILECQTDSCTAESYIQEMDCSCLPAEMLERPEFSVQSILEGNDKLTRFYTGLPSYKCFVAFVEYLQPKAVVLTP